MNRQEDFSPQTQARLGILVSGGGRTALNLADACARGAIDARVALVIAHREEIAAVERCRAAGLRVAVLPIARGAGDAPIQHHGHDQLDDRIDHALTAARVDLVVLAGYLRRFRVGNLWAGRALNIHPGLLPDFGGHGMYGDRVHRAVLASGARESGCTVHEVDGEYDRGPVVLERRCPVEASDTAEALAARVFALEKEAYPAAIAAYLSQRKRLLREEAQVPVA